MSVLLFYHSIMKFSCLFVNIVKIIFPNFKEQYNVKLHTHASTTILNHFDKIIVVMNVLPLYDMYVCTAFKLIYFYKHKCKSVKIHPCSGLVFIFAGMLYSVYISQK